MKSLIACGILAAFMCIAAPADASVPPPLRQSTAAFSSGSLHVQMFGTPGKQALIFIPGMTCGPWEWSREINAFSSNYTVYALTLPGFDGAPAIRQPLFQTVSADFWQMLAARRIASPIIVGHSLGGTLAIMLAEQHASQLRAIVAVDGLPIFPGNEAQTPAQRAQNASRVAATMASIATPQQFEAAEKTFGLPYLVTSSADIAAIAPLTARSDPAATAAWITEDLQLDLRPQLSAVTVPLLEIAPFDATIDRRTASPAAKQAYYSSLLAGAPRASITMVENSRHFIMLDQPAKLDARLSAFFKETSPE